MQESKAFQLILRETTIKHILALLQVKFQAEAVSALTPALENIDDLQRLEQLHLAAAQVESLEAFAQMLQE